MTTGIIPLENPELQMLINNKQSAYDYRKRRQDQWNENYTLYRDKVKTNRLTQRQSVNLPLMKQTLTTLLKELDDMPVIYFENLDNDKDAEIFQNEYWKWTLEINNAEIKDIIDKRQEMLFGRTFDQWQIANGKIEFTIQDPEDILVDRYTDPADLDSSRFLIHTHIFKPLATLKDNPLYDQEAVKRLEDAYANQHGLIRNTDNLEMFAKKTEKLQAMGVPDVESPILGETYVELTQHFVYREKEKKADGTELSEQLWLYVEADNMEILCKKPLEEVIGKTQDNYWQTHFPYTSWADDVERQDFWSDGVGDRVRTPNKILNIWFSQLVENRTLRSYGMNYFDSSIEGFQPPSIEPQAWGWIGVPGKPSEVFQKVDIPDLSESLDEMQFVIDMNDRASGATATQQGVQNTRQITLGEVQLMLGEAKERAKGIAKFYTIAWKKRAEKFLKLIEAAPEKLDAVTIYKKGRNTNNMYSRDIQPKDWMTKSGYTVRIWSQSEKNEKDMQKLERISAVSKMIPGNPKLTEILQRQALEFADLKPDEINDIMQQEADKLKAMPMGMMGMPVQPGMQPQQPQPAQPQLTSGLQQPTA